MLQCEQCEFFSRGPAGEPRLSCDPFANIKEPECLMKWQLLRLTQSAAAQQTTQQVYHRLGPLQDKMLRYLEREMNDLDETERWKQSPDEEDDDLPDTSTGPTPPWR